MLAIIALTILTIGFAFFFIGKNRIFKLCNAAQIRPHSLSIYHGSFPAVLATAPALILLSVWVGADDLVFNQMLTAQFPANLEIDGTFFHAEIVEHNLFIAIDTLLKKLEAQCS